MSTNKIFHDTFTLERTFDATPERVFAAWGDKDKKALWFAGPDGWKSTERTFDFRIDGREVLAGTFPDGKTSRFTATYFEIIPNERIVYAYDMIVNGKRLSISIATIEIKKVGSGTTMIVTEQGAFFDDPDAAASRLAGTTWLVEKVGASLGL